MARRTGVDKRGTNVLSSSHPLTARTRKGNSMNNVFQTAKQISPADVARKLGLKESHKRFCCPFHGDTHPSMAVYEDSKRFYCFACSAKGDATDLWAKVRGVSLKAAAEQVCESFGLQYRQVSREERERLKRVDDVAMLPEAVWKDWKRGVLSMLEEEVNACTRVMEQYADPEGWIWRFELARAVKAQDALTRLQAVEAKDLPAEIVQLREDGQAVVSDEVLRDILDDRLRFAGMKLDAQESDYVHKTLGVTPRAAE